MKRTRSKTLVLPLAVFFFLLSIGGEISVANASASVAIVKNVSGNATVARQGQTITATNGMEIWENDTLRTGRNGSIGIVFTR